MLISSLDMKAMLELLRGESEEFSTFNTWESLEEFLLEDSIKNHEETVKLSVELCAAEETWTHSFTMRPSELLQVVFALRDNEERISILYNKYHNSAITGDDH